MSIEVPVDNKKTMSIGFMSFYKTNGESHMLGNSFSINKYGSSCQICCDAPCHSCQTSCDTCHR